MKNVLSAVILTLAIPLAALATPVTFTATPPGGDLSARAVFDIVGGQLQITLSNISTHDVLVPRDVLTGVFFDVDGFTGSLTPVSAALAPGSTVLFGPNGGGNVGGEWAYASGLSGAPGGATEGISSAGLGLFGRGNFGGPNLDGPVAVGGLNYGLLSAGDNSATGNKPVTGKVPLVKDSVVFTLAYTGTLDLSDITNVSFQYGTDLSESNTTVPDGGMTITLLGLALAGMGMVARRIK